MKRTYLSDIFDVFSLLPTTLIVLGVFSLNYFLTDKVARGSIYMLVGFVIYMLNNLIGNIKGETSVFNEYLEDFGSFLMFGLTTIVFGIKFYSKNSYSNLILYVLIFYTLAISLNFGRSWILQLKNSMGWPVALNGLFFPLIYFIYALYLNSQGNSIFLIFYILVAILSLSSINFIGYDEEFLRNIEVEENKKFDRTQGFKK